MRSVKKCAIVCVVAVLLICGNKPVVSMAADSNVMPCYEEVASVSANLSYSNNVANCTVVVRGRSDVAKITGTAWLQDNNTSTIVESWKIDVNSNVCAESFSTDVEAGHSYTLYFAGTVYSEDGAGEAVHANVTKTN